VAVLAEAGVKAAERLRAGGGAVEVVERFAAQARTVDLSPDIARLAAELRATRGLKPPEVEGIEKVIVGGDL
jgi:hypothetical protein